MKNTALNDNSAGSSSEKDEDDVEGVDEESSNFDYGENLNVDIGDGVDKK